MKGLVNSLIAQLHIMILFYGLWMTWGQYEEHSMQIDEMVSQLPAIEQEMAVNKKKVKEIEDFAKKTDEYKVRVEGVAKNIENVQKQLPAEIDDAQILTFFNEEMTALNIKDPRIIPGREEVSTYFISKEYSLKARGTFLQFLILFERIGNSTRIYNVKNLKLVATDDFKKGRFQMISGEGSIQAYRYNPEFKVDRGFDKIESPTPK